MVYPEELTPAKRWSFALFILVIGAKARHDRYVKNYYRILGISPDADPRQIKQAYRILARKYHPDSANTVDEAKFIEVTEAYRVLINAESRQQYDLELRGKPPLVIPSVRQTPVTNAKELKPFMLIMVGFFAFSLFMLLVFVFIIIEYAPSQLNADAPENSSTLAARLTDNPPSQRCEVFVSVQTHTCKGKQSIHVSTDHQLVTIDWLGTNYRSIRLVFTFGDSLDGTQFHVQSSLDNVAELRLVDNILRIDVAETDLQAIPKFGAPRNRALLLLSHEKVLWHTSTTQDTFESVQLFNLKTSQTISINLNGVVSVEISLE